MPKEVTTTGRMDGGHLHVRNRETFKQAVAGLRDGEVEIIVRRKHATRSLQANAYYWGVVVKELSDHTGYTSDEIHELLKAKFLPAEQRVVRGKRGHVVAEFTVNGTTTVLNTLEFYEYCRDIKQWAVLELGVYIPDPQEMVA